MTEQQLIGAAIPVFLLTIAAEVVLLRRKRFSDKAGYELKDALASLAMGSGFLVISGVFKLALIPAYLWLHQFRLFDIQNVWWSWLLLFVLQDFCFYWAHRTHHSVRFMWAAHVNHHSSRHYNLSTALRQSWTEHLTGLPFFVPLVFLGFDPLMLVVVELINLYYQYWVHTETIGKLGWFEQIFNTPSHHRVHHGSNPRYIDRNHAGIFIVWDRMFGTFVEEAEPVVYGLTENIQTFNPVRIAFHEWQAMIADVRSAGSLKDAAGYIFGPPGWQPAVEQHVGMRNHPPSLPTSTPTTVHRSSA